MTSVNVPRMSMMFAHRRPLRAELELDYHSVRGYQELNFKLGNNKCGRWL